MNFMIKELTKSGMVTSFEDAIDKASNLYANAMPEERQREEIKPRSQAQPQEQNQVQPSLDLLERKFTNTMKQNNQAIANEMKKIWEELQSLKKQSVQAQQRTQQSPSQAQPVQQTPQPPKAESHPRQGDFTPTNVDLEQYFYYGKR
ncbi:MAG: hypothetical protein ACLFP2_05735 [Candidatus Woesearchaeota archaeon]